MPDKKSSWEKAKKHGVDVDHLADNLNKSYTQRFREQQNASNFIDALKKAGIAYYEKLRRNN